MKNKQVKNLGILILFLMLLFILIAGLLTAYFMSKEGKWMSYEQCEKLAGSRVQESYPRVCITEKGERFYNPQDRQGCGQAGRRATQDICN